MPYDNIKHMFNQHELTDEQKETCRVIRQKFQNLAELIEDACLDSREKSLVMTNLDTAAMYAVASIARQNKILEE